MERLGPFGSLQSVRLASLIQRRGSSSLVIRPARRLIVAAIALFLSLGLAAPAAAYSPSSGFSATTYTTLPSGTAAGVAFIGPVMYVVDGGAGTLYSVPSAGAPTPVATISGGPKGLAAFGGSLYATRSTANDLVRIDPVSGTSSTLLTSANDFAGLQLEAVAADAGSGDLYVTTDAGYVWVVHPPYLAADLFGTFGSSSPSLYGVAVAPDHTVSVVVPSGPYNGVWQIGLDGTPHLIGLPFSGGRGLGAINGYVFSNNADGTISKLVISGVGTGSSATALTGGDPGDLGTIGADGCFYASQGAAVIRLGSADGGCNLSNAAPPPPPPTLTLIQTSTNLPLIGNGDQSFSATLANVTAPAGVPVTFTVTRGSSSTTYTSTTGPNGVASFSYAATSAGTDVITASAIVNGTPITSNAITITYLRALDTIPPTITYTVSGDHNAPGPNGTVFSCPNPTLSTLGSNEYCGWYTSPPTIHFTVTASGPSGLAPYDCPDFTLNVDSPITGTPVTCNASNGDGYHSSLRVVLQALLTPPMVSATAATASGAYTGGPTAHDVTVTFACGSDPALGPGAISFCTPPITVSAEGFTTVSGSVLDVAGTRTTTSFGPILIDKSAPVVTASMRTATDGLPYVPGTPTAQDVIVTFTCIDTFDPNPACPAPVTVSSGSSVTVSSTDWVGNTKSYTFGGIVIDRVGPTVSAAVTPAPDLNGNNALTATVNITAMDPSGIGSITYSATGAQTIAATTIAASGAPGSFSVPVPLNAIGDTTVTYSAHDALGNLSATQTIVVHILATQPTTLAITSSPTLVAGGTVTAQLLALGTAPVAGQTITFTAGTLSATAVTDANGVASTTLGLAPGTSTLRASFAGTTAYVASSATPQALIVFVPTQFVIWGGNADGIVLGQRVIFWGEHWWDQVNLPESSKVKDFKGWAERVTGTTWTTKGGNSKPPKTIPAYISVIVTTKIERAGKDGIAGNIVRHAILRVDSPYKDGPGKPVYGVVIAFLP